MVIDRYEKIFMLLGVVILVVGLIAIAVSVFHYGLHVSRPAGRIDPVQARNTAPFDEPGVYETDDGEYEAVVLAETWRFLPDEIRVPAGSEVTFRMTSADVVHGIMIEKTAVNTMIIPGQISEVTHTFEQPGEYLFVCHEYCGTGHHLMSGRVVVE
ncbi:MAG: cytochrome c oxidase subunit II [Thermomicrobiaceae bacterium]